MAVGNHNSSFSFSENEGLCWYRVLLEFAAIAHQRLRPRESRRASMKTALITQTKGTLENAPNDEPQMAVAHPSMRNEAIRHYKVDMT